jgi:competence protein ComEC
LTHPDADHLTGLVSVLQRYKVEQILVTGVAKNSGTYSKWQQEIVANNIPVKKTKAADQYDLGGGVILKILGPDDALLNSSPDTNETSIVAQLVNQKIKILFTGDIQEKAENSILAKNYDIASDVLKVPHHGSANGLTSEFLAKIQPKTAVIEVGANNKYGHPHPSVLDKLKSQSVQIYRTDQNGEINLISDGLTYEVKTAK